MGIQTTDPVTGKPTFNNVSSTQSDFQALADWADPSRVAVSATYAGLPATGFPGQRILVNADPTPAKNGWYYWTSTWIQVLRSGLVPIVPSSVTGGTVNADGSVSFSAVASFACDGVFATGAFDQYVIELDQTTSSANTNLQYVERSGGVDAASVYFWNVVYSASAAVAAANAANTSAIQLTGQLALYRHTRIEVCNPAVAAIRTLVIADDASSDTSSAGQSRATGWHGTAAAFDGFKILSTVGTITGKLCIYGISNG